MPKNRKNTWFDSISKFLVSALYLTSAVSGAKSRKSDLDEIPHGQPFASLVIQNHKKLRSDLIYTPENLFAGVQETFDVMSRTTDHFAIETLMVFEERFVTREEDEKGVTVFMNIPELGDQLIMNSASGRKVYLFESQIYIAALLFGKALDKHLEEGPASSRRYLEGSLNEMGVTRSINDFMFLYYLNYASYTQKLILEDGEYESLYRDEIKEYDATLKQFFNLDPAKPLPRIFENSKRILDVFIKKLIKVEHHDDDYMRKNIEALYAQLQSLLSSSNKYLGEGFGSLVALFVGLKAFQRLYIAPNRIRAINNSTDIRALARHSLSSDITVRNLAMIRIMELSQNREYVVVTPPDARHLIETVPFVKEPVLNSKQKKKLAQKDKPKKEEQEIKPVDFGVYVPGIYPEDKPAEKPEKLHLDKLTKEQEAQFGRSLYFLFDKHREVFVPWFFRDIQDKFDDHAKYFFTDTRRINLRLMISDMLRITGIKKTDSEGTEKILALYTDTVSKDCNKVQLKDDSYEKIQISLLGKEYKPTEKPNLNLYPKQKGVVLVQNNHNALIILLETKHRFLKLATQINAFRKNDQKAVDKLLNYQQMAVIRHGAIHLDFKYEHIQDDVRLVFYQDALNKLIAMGDPALAEPRPNPIDFNTAHTLYKTFEAHSAAWFKERAKHIESRYEKCMDMIAARRAFLEDPIVKRSPIACEMLKVEIGEIYQQLRNAQIFKDRLDKDPSAQPAISARNSFAHK